MVVKNKTILGQLFVIATPIGNLDDITYRAESTLNRVDLIAAEDTRVTRKLLNRYQITTPVISLHEHNEEKRIDWLLDKLREGQSIALVSDAGTPLISDPGYKLIRSLQNAEIAIIPIPGPSALTTAMCALGIPCDEFSFYGFLPTKNKIRIAKIEAIAQSTMTSIVYESPRRIMSLMDELKLHIAGDREIGIAREMTKKFETIRRDKFDALHLWLQENPEQHRGEFVVAISGADAESKTHIDFSTDAVLKILLEALSTKQASKIGSKLTGESSKLLYKKAIELKNDK